VVVLGVVFEDFGFLDVDEVPDEVVSAEVFAPFFAVDEPAQCCQSMDQTSLHNLCTFNSFSVNCNLHLLRLRNIKLPSPQKSQHTKRIQPLLIPQSLQFRPQLTDFLVLFSGRVAWMSWLGFGSCGGVVIVVVFRIEVHMGGYVIGRVDGCGLAAVCDVSHGCGLRVGIVGLGNRDRSGLRGNDERMG
jgi:hypothetical protein